MKIETLILSSLIHNNDYARTVLPFVKPEYFRDSSERDIFVIIENFYKEYNSSPNTEVITVELQNKRNLNENEYGQRMAIVQELEPSTADNNWLLTETENFCKDRAVYNAILKSIAIADGLFNSFFRVGNFRPMRCIP